MTEPVARLNIAGFVFAIFAKQHDRPLWWDEVHQAFFTDETPAHHINVCHENTLPIISTLDANLLFHSVLWRLYQYGKQHVVVATLTSEEKPDGDGVAFFSEGYLHADVYFHPGLSDLTTEIDYRLNPFMQPFGVIMLEALLADNKGALFHATGVDDGGKGYLFLGESTAGKSTMARLWDEAGLRVLTDERVAVRKQNGRYLLYGTPWPSDYPVVSPDPVPLERIFFLRHAPQNNAQVCDAKNAAVQLIDQGYLPIWDFDRMERFLATYTDIANTIPAYDLGFVPDAEIIDFVRCVK